MLKFNRNPKSHAKLTLLAALSWLVSFSPIVAADEWQCVLPEAGAEHDHPPLRAISLSADKPDDVKENAEYRGSSRRYAQLRFGSASAARVAIVVDQISADEVDLYVDANRNRTIEPKERRSGEGRLWRVPLNVEYAQGEVFRRLPREMVFRVGSTGRTLSYAAAGFLQGRITLDISRHETLAVRRMDGDGNGFFTDPQDRLWIDLNGDGRWDPMEEQFLYATILTLGGQRYAVRSDEQATRLALARLEGTGTIQLITGRKSGPPIAEIAVTLVGRDGSAVGLRGAEAEAIVPVGEYRVSALTVALDDPTGGPRWNFVFSCNDPASATRWFQIEKDARLAIDPLEKLEFSTGPRQTNGRCQPGEDLVFQPTLNTVDGLLINTCYRGTHDSGRDGPSATIALCTSDGAVLSTAQSGFA